MYAKNRLRMCIFDANVHHTERFSASSCTSLSAILHIPGRIFRSTKMAVPSVKLYIHMCTCTCAIFEICMYNMWILFLRVYCIIQYRWYCTCLFIVHHSVFWYKSIYFCLRSIFVKIKRNSVVDTCFVEGVRGIPTSAIHNTFQYDTKITLLKFMYICTFVWIKPHSANQKIKHKFLSIFKYFSINFVTELASLTTIKETSSFRTVQSSLSPY